MTALGIGISQTELRAVARRRGQIVWRGSRPYSGDDSLEDALASLLAERPRARAPLRMSAVAAIGPAASQMKRLSGIPRTLRERDVRLLLQTNASRFFLRNGAPIAPPAARYLRDAWWGATADLAMVTAVQRACDRQNVRLLGCIPAIAAMARTSTDGTFHVRDGTALATVTVRGRAAVELHRRNVAAASDATTTIAAMCDGDGRFADAIAAATCHARSPLLLRTNAGATPTRRFVVWLACGALVATSVAAALLGPAVAAAREAAINARRLDALAPRVRELAPATTQIREAARVIGRIAAYERGRRSMTQMLGTLTRALPDSTAIVSIGVDGTNGSMSVLSSHAAAVLPRLATVDSFTNMRIAGEVTRETVNGAMLQRVAIRFRFAR